MAPEIDLVPGEYRRALALRRRLLRFGLLYLAILLLVLTTKGGLAWGIRLEQRQIEALQAAEAVARSEQARLDGLRAERQRLDRRLALLEALRGGMAARHLFVVVDRALDGNVWFRHWSFRRAGEVVEREPEAVHAGYFVVLPRESGKEPEQGWLMRTHMEIRGQARDHSSLAAFVGRLVQQPEIEEVRVLSTRIREYTATQLVDFDLAVVVRERT